MGIAGGLSELSGAEHHEGAAMHDLDAGGRESCFQFGVFGPGIEDDARGLRGEEGIGHARGKRWRDVHRDGVQRFGDVRKPLEHAVTLDFREVEEFEHQPSIEHIMEAAASTAAGVA